jgi:hypothetical protein
MPRQNNTIAHNQINQAKSDQIQSNSISSHATQQQIPNKINIGHKRSKGKIKRDGGVSLESN